jgi:glycerophosphoryl diester phosphodiesterase
MPRLERENTLASFRLALESGAQGIELDVHATEDGVVVVHHDAELASGKAIHLLTHRELLERAAGKVEIPTLAEVCALVRGRAELFVEIKGGGIERQVELALEGYDGPVAIHSFDIALIERLAHSGTTFRLGVLPPEDGSLTVGDVMRRTGALDVWPHFPLVDAALVAEVHAAGGRVIPWTVNDREEARRLAALGVDGICTDDVTMLLP